MAEPAGAGPSIADKCSATKETLSNILTTLDSAHDKDGHHGSSGVLSGLYMRDQFDKFRLWAGHLYVYWNSLSTKKLLILDVEAQITSRYRNYHSSTV
jgi:hypothetical protein